MQIVPLQPAKAQTVTVQLAGQSVKLTVYQKSTGLLMDVALNDEPLITAVACQHARLCLNEVYLGFPGDLAFFDTQGVSDPVYTGLGSRWVLAYLQ